MYEKVQNALKLFGVMLPAPVRGVILEMASEVDKLRAEVEQLKKQ